MHSRELLGFGRRVVLPIGQSIIFDVLWRSRLTGAFVTGDAICAQLSNHPRGHNWNANTISHSMAWLRPKLPWFRLWIEAAKGPRGGYRLREISG